MARAVLVAAVEQLLIEALVATRTTAKYDVDVTNGSKEESILDRTSCNTQTPTAWKACTTNILRLMLVETRHPPAPCRPAISRPPEHLPAREHSSPRAAQVPPPPHALGRVVLDGFANSIPVGTATQHGQVRTLGMEKSPST